MTFKGVGWILYSIFTYPFKRIWRYFNPIPPVVSEPKKNTVDKFVLKFSPKERMETPNELQGKVHYKYLFLPDHFSALSDAKNDKEFKEAREVLRKKEERVKAKDKFIEEMKKLEAEREIERFEKLYSIFKELL